jgi:hypothetical protein
MTSAAPQTGCASRAPPSSRPARNGAWFALIGSVHWKMLADLLGVADTTASAWHRENGSDRAGYVAGRLPQGQAHRWPRVTDADGRGSAVAVTSPQKSLPIGRSVGIGELAFLLGASHNLLVENGCQFDS